MLKILIQKVRWIAIGAVVFGAIVFVARKQHTAAEEYERERQARCVKTSLSPEQQETCKHERDSPKDYLPWWYVLVAWPEGITVWAIIGTGFVIGWQAWETRKASKATLKSVKLQEAQLRQWVETANWEATTSYIQENAVETTLLISCDLGNPTKMLLTLKSILASAEPIWSKQGRQDVSITLQYVLAPDNPYPIKIPLRLWGESFQLYKNRKLTVVIKIKVGFNDAFEVFREQELGFTCRCGPTNWSEFQVYQSTHAIENQAEGKYHGPN